MVDGILNDLPSAIALMVALSILPDRVFGNLLGDY